jgi:GntR family transcriptional regulator, arabinose operon transcriptional repressor
MSTKTRTDKSGYKYAQIKTDLSIQILEGQLRPHDRIPSLNEITQKYKVSKITARRVLNDLVTEGLVYASRGRGSFVSDDVARQNKRVAREKNRSLGVVFEHASGSFMSDIIMGIDEEAFDRKAQITLCLSNNSYEREAENLERLVQQGVDRILLFMVLKNDSKAVNVNIPLYLRLQDQGVRLLLIACNIPGVQIPSITYDDYNAFRRLVKHVREQDCRRLLYVTRIDNASTTIERLRGLKDGLLEFGLTYDTRSVLSIRIRSMDTVVSDTAAQVVDHLRQGAEFDAILCSDEMVAAGVFDALEQTKGTRRRDRLPLVGGMGSARNLHVLKGNPYILLEDDTHRLGREAAAMMLGDSMPRPGESDMESLHRVLPVPLRLPKSTRR